MATYTELWGVARDNTMLDKFTSAVAIAAEAVRSEVNTTTNHANRLLWARQAYSDPRYMASKMTWAVLAQNAGLTLTQITSATDAQIQTAINNAVDVFANGTAV